MSEKWSIEMHRRIYDDTAGQYLTVKPDGDSLDLVEIVTEASQHEYFGKLRLTLPPAGARALAKAIIALADELEAK